MASDGNEEKCEFKMSRPRVCAAISFFHSLTLHIAKAEKAKQKSKKDLWDLCQCLVFVNLQWLARRYVCFIRKFSPPCIVFFSFFFFGLFCQFPFLFRLCVCAHFRNSWFFSFIFTPAKQIFCNNSRNLMSRIHTYVRFSHSFSFFFGVCCTHTFHAKTIKYTQ